MTRGAVRYLVLEDEMMKGLCDMMGGGGKWERVLGEAAGHATPRHAHDVLYVPLKRHHWHGNLAAVGVTCKRAQTPRCGNCTASMK